MWQKSSTWVANLKMCDNEWIKASSKISTNLNNQYTIWKPLTHRFQKCKIWIKTLTLCKLVFSEGITAWEQRQAKKIGLKIFPNLLFYQFISKLFASPSTLFHLSMTQRFWENLDYIKFRSSFAVSIEISKFSEAKNFRGYVVPFCKFPMISLENLRAMNSP